MSLSFDTEQLVLTTTNMYDIRPEGVRDDAEIYDQRSAIIACIQMLIFYGKGKGKVVLQGIEARGVKLLTSMFPDYTFTTKLVKGDYLVSSFPSLTFRKEKERIYKEEGITNKSLSTLTQVANERATRFIEDTYSTYLDTAKANMAKVKPKVSMLKMGVHTEEDKIEFYSGTPFWGIWSTDLWILSKTDKGSISIKEWLVDELDTYLYYHNNILKLDSEYVNVITGESETKYDQTAEMQVLSKYHDLAGLKMDEELWYNRVDAYLSNL
jgi:hypothetical protein